MRRIQAAAFFLCAVLCALAPCHAQEQPLLSSAAGPGSGKDRAAKLIDLSTKERLAGHLRNAVEYATLGSAEAEKSGQDLDQTRGLLELAKAQNAKGDIENAIGAAVRATLVSGTVHSSLRTNALLYLASLYIAAGHPQKALEHLQEARTSTAADQISPANMLRVELAANAGIMQPKDMADYCLRLLSGKVAQDDQDLQYNLLAHLATAQASLGQNAEALNTEERLMRRAIAEDRAQDAAISANNKAELYNRLGEREKSIEAYNQGLILVEDLPEVRLNMTINVVHAMAAAGHRDAALLTLEDAKRQVAKAQLPAMMPRVLLTSAAVNFTFNDLANAQASAFEALTNAEEQHSDKDQAEACNILASVFERMHLDQESRQYERRAGEIEERIARKQDEERAEHDSQLLRLQRVEREQTDLLDRTQRKETRLKQLALDAENREKQMSLLVYEKQLQEAATREAAMVSERTKRELLLVQASLERERQDRKIRDLDNSRMMQTLNLSRMKAEQRDQQRTMELLEQQNKATEMESQAIKARQAKQQAIRNLIIAVAVAGFGFAGWMYWAWLVARRKKRLVSLQNEKITAINTELDARNRDIESSLEYARTIQSTIIPAEQALRDLVPESFLMYRPLHNVSGDLPFVKRLGNRLFVAAIDCTGHGVPAAMMTFIAYYGLNDLLAEYPASNSAELLNMLHEHVLKTMNARSESGLFNDGFDIGLCAIDLDNGQLCYAGAQLPLLLLRRGKAERFKGDVLPLGDDRYQRTEGYKAHQIQLETGDSLFLFSDGIIHQFGGPDGGKKFSMKRLTQLLEQAGPLGLPEVKAIAEREFEDWKKGQPQTDDVLLIGMRYAA
jgi:serine phosphatase RsbU (regulator of sigma subunit)